jgi:hypothetical protein
MKLSGFVWLAGLAFVSAAPAPVFSAPVARGQAASLGQFKRDPVRAKQNLAKFIDALATRDPAGAAKMRTELATVDLFTLAHNALGTMGLDSENIIDVMTAVWISSWQASVGQFEKPDRAMVSAVNAQLHRASAKVAGISAMSNTEMQDAADDLLLRVIFFEAAVEQWKTQGANGQTSIKSTARGMAQASLGIDITEYTLDARGISPRGTAAGSALVKTHAAPSLSPAIPAGGSLPDVAQLKAASNALPQALKSIRLTKKAYYNSYGAYSVEIWMLFPGGLATQCPKADVGKIQSTRAWFKAQKCETGDWRVGKKGVEIREDGETTWDDDTFPTDPTPAGAVFDAQLRSFSGGMINGGSEGITTSTADEGNLTLSRAGWLSTRRQTSITSTGKSVFAGNISPESQARTSYYIIGNVITLGFPDGHIEHRYAVFEVEKGALEYVYLNDTFYFKD